MRVLFVNPFGGLGGSERSLLDSLASLRASVPSVESRLLVFAEGALAEQARAQGVPVDVRPMPSGLASLGESSAARRGVAARALSLLWAAPGFAGYVASLRRATRAFAPHVLHTNGMKAHVLMAATAPELPRVVHLRDFASERPLSRHLLPLLGRGALVVTNSVAVERDALRVAPRLRTRVVYNGIDLDAFHPGPRELTHLANLARLPVPPPDTCVVGLLATYAWWKGHRTFLNAAARVRQAAPELPLRFYVVGGPIYGTPGSELSEREIRDLVRELGLADSVGLVPFQTDPARVYRDLDVVVHASERPEPFGRTIVEGMATGRPVVAARAGGAAELFDEGETALGHRPGDPEDLARALLRLAGDAGLRKALGRRARAAAEQRFDRRRLGPELHAAYVTLLGERLVHRL